MGEYLAYPGEVGGRCVDIGEVLPVRCAGNNYFRLGYVNGDTKNWEGPGGFHHRVARKITENQVQ